MARPPYRRASGHPALAGPRLRRVLMPPLLLVIIGATMGLLAGGQVLASAAAWLQGAMLLPMLLPAAMLGLAVTAPLAKADVFAPCGWPRAGRLVLSLALGCGGMSLGMLGLGAAHLLHHGIPVLLLIAAAGVGYIPARDFWRSLDRSFWIASATRHDALLLLAGIPLAVLLLATSFAPGQLWRGEYGWYDVLEYHLQMPREYVAAHQTAPVPHNAYSYLPANVEMLYTLIMSLIEAVAPGGYLLSVYPAQLLHALLVLLTAAAVALAPLDLRPPGRVLAFLLMLATPWTLVIGSQAYNDGGVLLYGSLAFVWTLGPLAKSPRWIPLIVGALLGLAVGCKLTAGVMIAVPAAVLLLIRREWRGTLTATAVACAVFAPWAIRDLAATGNPVFPIAARTLGLGPWTAQQSAVWDRAHGAPPEARTPGGRLRAFADASLLNENWSPSLATLQSWIQEVRAPQTERSRWPWRLGLFWLLLPCMVVFAWWQGPPAWGLLAAAAVQVAGWLCFTHLQSRFLTPLLIPLALLLALSVQTLGTWRALAGVVIALQSLLTPFVLLEDLKTQASPHETSSPFVFAGALAQAPEAFIYPEFFFHVPENAPPPPMPPAERKVLLVGSATPFYYRGQVTYNTVWDRNLLGDLLRTRAPAEIVAWLHEQQIQYVIVDWAEVTRLAAAYGYDPAITPEAIASLHAAGLQPVALAPNVPGTLRVYAPPSTDASPK